jgi:hypothetical protein
VATDEFQGFYVETRDYAATAAFWASLGFEAVFETGHGSGQWRHRSGGPYVFINEQHDTELQTHPILRVDDPAAFRPDGTVDYAKPFTTEHWGVSEALIRDPDGRVVSLQAPLSETADADGDADGSTGAAGTTPPTQEFEGDLTGAVFWGADLTGTTFRDVDLTNVAISHARLVDVTIDARIEGLVVNGVDVTDYVNERDPWFPLRSMLEPTDPAGLQAAWSAIEETWADTVALARGLTEADLHRSVDGEWSFVDTLRHVVFAIDKWFTAPIVGASFDPIGLPNSGSVDFPWPGLDQSARPTFVEALAVYQSRVDAVRGWVESVTPDELERHVDVLENGDHAVRECLWVVFEEAFWHHRYAQRDLDSLIPSG